MTYIFEKGCNMPLCGCIEDNYYKFDDGEVIENPSVIDFINKGLSLKTMHKEEVNLEIYKILNGRGELYGYRYVINGANNFLDPYKQPFNKYEASRVADKILSGTYKQELLWGENDG